MTVGATVAAVRARCVGVLAGVEVDVGFGFEHAPDGLADHRLVVDEEDGDAMRLGGGGQLGDVVMHGPRGAGRGASVDENAAAISSMGSTWMAASISAAAFGIPYTIDACAILGDRVQPDVPERRSPSRAVTADAGQQHRDTGCRPRPRHALEEHVHGGMVEPARVDGDTRQPAVGVEDQVVVAGNREDAARLRLFAAFCHLHR